MTSRPEAGAGRELLEGTVVRRSSNTVWVDTPAGEIACALRGKLRLADPCVVGDRARVLATGRGVGAVEEVLPRRSALRRGAITGIAGDRITAANVDRVAVVVAAAPLSPRWGLVDRLLVEAGLDGLEPLVVLNKVDLIAPASGEEAAIEEAAAVYRDAGVGLIAVSALRGDGIEGLAALLVDRVTVLSGHSGMGKTALLNALVPGLGLRTGDLNPVTGKGRHTTTSPILVKLPRGGYAMDTPGFREFPLAGVGPPELGRFYPEFREAIAACRFRDCLHLEEPGCGVRSAVEDRRISKLRYQNYLQILQTLVERDEETSQRRSARRRSRESS